MSVALGLLLVAQLNSFEFSPLDSSRIAGDSFSITIVARDPYGGIYPFNGIALLSTTRDAYPNTFVRPDSISFNNGVWQQKVIVTLAESLALRCEEPQSQVSGLSDTFEVLSGPPDKLLLVLPGETHAPGLPSGRTGSALPEYAGRSFDFDVYVTDEWSNTVRGRNDSVRFDATDSFAVLPTAARLSNGRGVFAATLRQAGQHNLSASPSGGSTVQSGTSSDFLVRAGAFNRLLLVLPGETPLPGDPTPTGNHWETPGKSGRPAPQYIRSPFFVKVYACDDCWNRVSIPSDSIELGSDFQFTSVPDAAGLRDSAVFMVEFTNSGMNQNIWASEIWGSRTTYPTLFDVLSFPTFIDVSAPDTVRAGETAYVQVTLTDANREPVETWCHFSVFHGSGRMLDDSVYSAPLGRVRNARFLCDATRGAEWDSIEISAGPQAFKHIGIYVDRPDSSAIGAYPNPFGFNLESATIWYFLETASQTDVNVYDPFGNPVRSWSFSSGRPGGQRGLNRVQWDGRNDRGRRVANGIYVVQVLALRHTGTTFRQNLRIGVVW